MRKIFYVAVFLLLAAGCTRSAEKTGEDKSVSAAEAKPPLRRTFDDCKSNHSLCATVDIDSPQAKEAYELGCGAGEAYSCVRLGQLHEIKSGSADDAVKAYEKSCTGGEKIGCESEQELRLKLCYLEKKQTYCKGEPTGEYRTLVFLESLDPKYQDAFVERDFSLPFSLDQVRALYEKRITEKNPKLLKALRAAQKQGKRDGANAEGIQIDIWKLEGNQKMLEGLEE